MLLVLILSIDFVLHLVHKRQPNYFATNCILKYIILAYFIWISYLPKFKLSVTVLPDNVVWIACGDEFVTGSGKVIGVSGDVVRIACVDMSFTGSDK